MVVVSTLRAPIGAAVSKDTNFHQTIPVKMWTSVCFQESVSMDVVSIWTEPTSAAVTMVTKSHPTAELVKISTSVQLVMRALRDFVSTQWVPSLARIAGPGLDCLLMD